MQGQSDYSFHRGDKTEQRKFLIIGIISILLGVLLFYGAIIYYNSMNEAASQLEESEESEFTGGIEPSYLYEMRNNHTILQVIPSSIFIVLGSYSLIKYFIFNKKSQTKCE